MWSTFANTKDSLISPGYKEVLGRHLRAFRKVICQLSGSPVRLAFNQDSIMKPAKGTLPLIRVTCRPLDQC